MAKSNGNRKHRVGIKKASKEDTETRRHHADMSNNVKEEQEPRFSTDALMDQFDIALEQLQPEMAYRIGERALQQDPNNLRALECMGYLCVDNKRDIPSAVSFLKRAVDISPDTGAAKYMYMGQLSASSDALKYFIKGIELMEVEVPQQVAAAVEAASNNGDDTEAAATTVRDCAAKQIAIALCAMADIYMTDCCFEENAQEECGACLSKALTYDATNVEVLNTMTSYLISCGEPLNALKYLRQNIALWHNSETFLEPDTPMPDYQSRVQTVQLLMELNEAPETTAQILARLLMEDDEVVQVWYLHGWFCYRQQDFDECREILEHARELHFRLECDDHPLLLHIDEILSEL